MYDINDDDGARDAWDEGPDPDGYCPDCGSGMWSDPQHGGTLWCATCREYRDDADRCPTCEEPLAPGWCEC